MPKKNVSIGIELDSESLRAARVTSTDAGMQGDFYISSLEELQGDFTKDEEIISGLKTIKKKFSIIHTDNVITCVAGKQVYAAQTFFRKLPDNEMKNALKFEINAEEDILKLERELKAKAYRPSRSILFAARRPKLREIFAADFRDRVVHHILVDYLERIWEKVFIYDSYACRKGKGTHKAVMRLQSFLRKVSKNGRVKAYYLQMDIKDFFTSIDKEILYNLIKKKIGRSDMLWLVKKIIFWDCAMSYIIRDEVNVIRNIPANKSLFGKGNKRGLPIGNLTSQFFANVYLNELDQFVKHILKVKGRPFGSPLARGMTTGKYCIKTTGKTRGIFDAVKYYIRYVDDFILLSDNRGELVEWKSAIERFLSSMLKLVLHPRRQKLQPVSNGIDFLGYIVRHNYILVRRRVINNCKARLRYFEGLIARNNSRINKQVFGRLRDSIHSYLGHFKWANCYRLMQDVKQENHKRRIAVACFQGNASWKFVKLSAMQQLRAILQGEKKGGCFLPLFYNCKW